MDLREELPGDREPVRKIHRQAFGDHGLVVTRLVDTLRETITPADGLSLVAEHDGQIVGHVMFTRSLLDAGLKALAEQAVPLVFLEGDGLLLTLRLCARLRPGLPETVLAHSRWCIPGHQAPGV